MHGIAPQAMVHLILGRRFIGRALGGKVHTLHRANALFLGNAARHVKQFVVVDFVHVGETRSCREVWPMQRVLGHKVDVVGDEHDVADIESELFRSVLNVAFHATKPKAISPIL